MTVNMTIEELYAKLCSPEFRTLENGSVFYNYYIYQYPASEEYEIRRQIKAFKENLIRPNTYVDVLTLDLFECFCEFLDKQSFGKMNPSLLKYLYDKDATNPAGVTESLEHYAHSDAFFGFVQQKINDFVREDTGLEHPYVFIYGMGKMFPYLRTNNFLTSFEGFNDTSKYKIIVFYPGERKDNSFALFNRLDDAHSYRAILLVNE